MLEPTDPASAEPTEENTPGGSLPPRRRRRAASRPAGAPAPAPEASADTPAEPASAAERSAGTSEPAEAASPAEPPQAAAEPPAKPARTRRRATRKVAAPAPTEEETAQEPAEESAEEPAAPAKRSSATARRATQKPVVKAAARGRSGAKGKNAAPRPEDEESVDVAEKAADQAGSKPAGQQPTVPAFGATGLFQPPVFTEPAFQTPQSVAEQRAGAAGTADDEDEDEESRAADAVVEPERPARRRRRRGADPEPDAGRARQEAPAAPAAPAAEAAEADAEDDAEADTEDRQDADESGERPARRRRRGGRRRRRGDSAEDGEGTDQRDGEEPAHAGRADDEPRAESHDDTDGDDDGPADEGGAANSSSSSSRRRRRRRRRSGDEGPQSEPAATVDDPERTVVKVREPRKKKAEDEGDGVQAVKGSTRLEAKKQRRREGREQGRRRVPIITEAEFLARREAVKREMIVRQSGERTQIAVLEDDVLVEHFVNKEQASSYVGNVYLGKVQNVLPSMEAAFVDIGKGRNAVLYAGEVNFEALGVSGGPRRIETALKSGQPVLVQVTKDPIGHKGARLTSQVSLPGRYLVYVPEGSMTGISRKLPDTERSRLKTILKRVVPENAGVIVRTAAEGASEDELARDVQRLQAQWEDIKRKAQKGNAPTLLYGEPDMTVRVVRDIFNEDFTKVVVSGDEAWDTIHGYVTHVAPDLAERLQKWTAEVDVFATYRIDEQLMKALDRKVWLPSGGSLVIDRTEAMIVVDVNTGKFTGQGGNLEETVTRNNLEAAEEIVRQLRLRDLGGIIVIDFIDMVLESNRELVLRRLLECLGRDRTKHQVAEVTSLGLVQMTRKRVGQGLLESFSEPCTHCNGRGLLVHMEQAHAAGGGGGKRGKKKGRGGGQPEPVAEPAPVESAPAPEPVAAAEPKTRPEPAFEPDDELYSSVAEAEEAASRHGRRGRRRVSRGAEAPPAEAAPAEERATEPEIAEPVTAESATPESATAEPEPAVAPAPATPARTRRRGSRKVSVPAGAPVAADEDAVTVLPATASGQPEPERPVVAEARPVDAPAEEPAPARRRRASRKVSVPAGPPKEAEESAVTVVAATASEQSEQSEPGYGQAEPESVQSVVAEARPVDAPSEEPAPARRRRASRKVSVPAGAPVAADEDAVTVLPAAAPGEPVAESVPEPEPATAAAATTPTRRRVTRRVSAPVAAPESDAPEAIVLPAAQQPAEPQPAEPQAPAAAPADEAPAAPAEAAPGDEAQAKPAKKTARKTAAKKASAKKAATKATAKKTAAKKTTAKKAATKTTAKKAAATSAAKKTTAKKTATKKAAASGPSSTDD
ncbi:MULTISPECIES: ribonuclease E/G [Streptomyces]|uniref:ribonuclease E/G n=1 Tax=Streptomyces TaxID=1883 RepID=UPI00224979B6|nr:ribonuclease E/G [Streptomyces sp. JHD 1]MCX2969904.1 Rne/Rng family ribonuclease [Streptomyces sp. JHD 1]